MDQTSTEREINNRANVFKGLYNLEVEENTINEADGKIVLLKY